ncbi:uncharacterized protein LOC123537911 [Mercenaria mercenaria]|uniref:uncharacterized protein LOC123537911 n=1 Tax=Mercenaria mercenaria TaxID=6596 RepID=UPI00234E3743|nr:uncharacterized protein LOC123537911 [Mercenaria mercenaria]
MAMERYLMSILILCTVFTSSVSQSAFEEIPINTPTSTRIMTLAATHIGVQLTRQISAFKRMNYPLYRVNFEGRNNSGLTLTCNAVVYERTVGNGFVTRWYCRW